MPTLYRCYLCPGPKGTPGLDFTADKPVCPACGADPATDPRDAGAVVRLEVLHFDPPSGRPHRGRGHAACNPALKVGAGGVLATGEPSVVNCPACRAAAAWTLASGWSVPPAVPPAADVAVTIDPATLTITPAEGGG